nr:right-handed parallel beta-helix repeat-containing protein [Pseudofulvimonas gallinarii]
MSRPTLFAAVLIAVASGQARADTFTVTSTASVGPGTLYQAIDDSNQIPGPHSIAFDLPADSVIAMQHQPVPVISSVLSIDGANVPGLVLDGADVVRLFHVAGPNSEFTLANIEVRRGRGSRRGGCLFVQAPTKTTAGKVTLDTVVMRGCQAVRNASNETVSGGAIYLEGRDMSVINSQFLDNETYSVDPGLATVATGGAIAVVIESQHTVLIQDSQFIANRVTGSSASGSGCCRAKGAVIDASGSGLIVVEGSRIIANQGRTLDFSTDMGGIIKSTMSTSLKNNLFFDNDSIGTMINLEMGWSPGSFVRIHNNTLVANRTEFGTSIFLYAVADASLINNTFLSWISPGHPLPHLRVAGHGTTPNALILGHNLFGPADSRWPDPAHRFARSTRAWMSNTITTRSTAPRTTVALPLIRMPPTCASRPFATMAAWWKRCRYFRGAQSSTQAIPCRRWPTTRPAARPMTPATFRDHATATATVRPFAMSAPGSRSARRPCSGTTSSRCCGARNLQQRPSDSGLPS